MNNELEETIKRLNKDKNKPLACGDVAVVNIEDLETVLNYIENSVSKEVIEKKIEEYKEIADEDNKDYFIRIDTLQELLEEN